MYNKIANSLERALYSRVNVDSDFANRAAKLGAVAGVALYALPKAGEIVAGKMAAYAQIPCTLRDLDAQKIIYESNVEQLNQALEYFKQKVPDATAGRIHEYIVSGDTLNKIYQAKSCLESYGVNTDALAHFSNEVMQAITKVPEFGQIAAGVTAASIFAAIIASKIVGKYSKRN